MTGRHCAFCLAEVDAGAVKLCGKCKKRAYCSKECQASDWSLKKCGQGHKNWCDLGCGEEDVDFKVSPITGKGLGLVALRDIPSRYRILVERPVDMNHPRVAELMPYDGTLKDKVLLNRLGCAPDDNISNALCLRIARANHSCNANAGHIYDGVLKVKVLFAERDIKEGEEICISYISFNDISSTETPSEGRLKLMFVWRIQCDQDCLCYDEAYFRKIKYARELDKTVFRLGSSSNVEGAIIQVKQLIELENALNLSWISRRRTFYDGFQTAIMKRKLVKQGLEFAAKQFEISKDIQHPEKSEEVQDLKMWMSNPQSHSNFGGLG